ncbi:A/G-specific adenine glycosylase [Azospira restricta]|uniref:Adenine DNA glycosylase n=1 Tax=Azospira restricta TaxID=404405 RepID=A0A974SQA8_9RHOO|nr:A/G-specific adenine glycosylase [Azospira restricta]QRJ64546.1 A/G-specific adenine glycosylase [Azospira restricta]
MNDFAARLVAWQKRHGRHDLPWQRTRDPYRIWLSEIMLQQTQVATVIPYYARFLARFPDLASLAAAPLAAVLELWAGLGYYARARNLHRCAQAIVAGHGGNFPESAALIAELPGIGKSTAAAIAAFAFGERGAILDGNVKRVLARCFGVDGFPGQAAVERELWALAESLLPAADIEAYTQGQMDLGATLCTRGKPRCGECPLRGLCVAERDGRQGELPAARPAKAVPERESTVTLFVAGDRVLLERRPPSGIWGGLLAPPEGQPPELAARFGLRPLGAAEALPALKHAFTHFRLTLQPWRCPVAAPPPAACDAAAALEWVAIDAAASAALPAPVRKLLERLAAAT